MQACHGLCERANFNWTSSDGEKDTKKAFISMVSDAVYPAGLLSSKQRDAVLPVFEPVQCDRNAGGEAAFTGSECTRQRICDEENADTGCPRAFRDASRKETKRMAVGIDLYGLGKLFQFMLAYTSVVPPLTWKEEFMMSLVIQKCTGENGKKTYREFDQILRELPRGDRRKSCFRKIKKAL